MLKQAMISSQGIAAVSCMEGCVWVPDYVLGWMCCLTQPCVKKIGERADPLCFTNFTLY